MSIILNKIVNFPSVQAGPFSAPLARMIDFDIPNGYTVDMSNSFVEFKTSMNVVGIENGPPDDLCVYNVGLTNRDYDGDKSTRMTYNVDLIQNCNFSSAKKGRLEDIRRVNFLTHTLNDFTHTTTNNISQIDTLYQLYNYDTNLKYSPFLEVKKSGDIKSRYITPSLKTPMSQLLYGFGNQVINTDDSEFGRCRLHLELHPSNYFVGDWIPNVSPGGQSGIPMNDAVTNGLNIFTVDVSEYYGNVIPTSLDSFPFIVGQAIRMNADDPDELTISRYTYITAIDFILDVTEPTKASITITVNDPFTITDPIVALTNIIFFEIAPRTMEFRINEAQLNLMLLPTPPKVSGPSVFEYMTFSLEEYSNNDAKQLQRIFQLEPNAVNLFVMFNDDTNNLLSVNQYIQNYRLRVDNEDIVDRDINVNKGTTYIHDPLHYELLNKTFKNSTLPLKSILCNEESSNYNVMAGRYNLAPNQIMVISTPLNETQNEKNFQLNLTSNPDVMPGIKNVLLYKQIIKQVKL